MRSKIFFLFITISMICGCKEDETGFKGAVEKVAPLPEPEKNSFVAITSDTYTFELKTPGDKYVFPNTEILISPYIFRNSSNNPLEKDLTNWKLSLKLATDEPRPFGPVAPIKINLSQHRGVIAISGVFKNQKDDHNGQVLTSIYVDSQPPRIFISDFGINEDGSRIIYWSVLDDYAINEKRLVLYGCEQESEGFFPNDFSEFEQLPTECQKLHEGDHLAQLEDKIAVPSAIMDEKLTASSMFDIFLYAEDEVGHGKSKKLDITQKQKELILTPGLEGISYTNILEVSPAIELNKIQDAQAIKISDEQNKDLWPDYEYIYHINETTKEMTFSPSPIIKLGNKDGIQAIKIAALDRGSSLKSNEIEIQYVVDRLPPSFSDVDVLVDNGILSKDSPVSINWKVMDKSGIKKQTVYIKVKGDKSFRELVTLDPFAESYTFPWPEEKEKSFQIKVTATDLADNIGEGLSDPWVPQIFNAAVLTQSVSCFFCHLKIEGDVGGINFPASVHGASGQMLSIAGTLFSTNAIPSLLKNKAINDREFYKNSELKIFPKDTTNDGIPDFPNLTRELLKSRMMGSLKYTNFLLDGTKKASFISRIHVGNVILDGSKDGHAITIDGEVYIDGDLIIKGTYQGVGTIYANNIYVVDDLIALNSPFSNTEDNNYENITGKLGTDGLYLGSLNHILVGDPDHGLDGAVTWPTWVGAKSDFESLGRQAKWLLDGNGNKFVPHGSHIGDPTTDSRVNIEVNRVDAFLYAQKVFVWRSYANFLINGGFMAPKASLVSSVPRRIYLNNTIDIPINPRNGLKADQNIIRYDYRLRSGGKGFETVKEFFDQQ